MSPLPRFNLSLAAIAALLSFSGTAHALAGCEWERGSGLDFSHNIGSYWVPRDTPIGSKIGNINRTALSSPSAVLACKNDGSKMLRADMRTPLAIVPGDFQVDGKPATGKVLKTDIEGVGLYLELGSPVNSDGNNHFRATDGVGAVPFTGENQQNMDPTYLQMSSVVIKYAALIKTGTIRPGSFNQLVVNGEVTEVGNAIRINLSGQVQQAQCTLKADAVSANPVQMGTHNIDDFEGVGSTTAPVDFHITLSDCEDDPAGSVARAFMRLDGVDGSVPLDRDRGLFSLTTESSDSGTSGIGIQVLHRDGRPLKLEEFVDMAALTPGLMRLDLRAQYYQTDTMISPGLANGALNFTINYR